MDIEKYINDNLLNWNLSQMLLWNKLIENFYVVDSLDYFMEFSAWFRAYFCKNNCFPLMETAISDFLGEKNET